MAVRLVSARTLRVMADLPRAASPAAVYGRVCEALPAGTVFTLGSGACRELRRELHSIEAVGEWAAELAVRCDRVVMLNFEFVDGTSRTITLAPPGWTSERLQGFIAGRREELEDLFGPITAVTGGAE